MPLSCSRSACVPKNRLKPKGSHVRPRAKVDKLEERARRVAKSSQYPFDEETITSPEVDTSDSTQPCVNAELARQKRGQEWWEKNAHLYQNAA